MARNPKLTDLHLVLLSAAAARSDGMVLPPPESVRARGTTLERSLHKLLDLGLVAECAATAPEQVWRRTEEGGVFGLAITKAGHAALGLGNADDLDDDPGGAADTCPGAHSDADIHVEVDTGRPDDPIPFTPGVKRGTKQARLVDLLIRPTGATVEDLATTLGWKHHTVRAALTGLRRKGYEVALSKDDAGRASYRAALPAMAHDDVA